MKYIVDSEEMKMYDKNTTSFYKMPEIVLVEQAAGAMSNEVSKLLNKASYKKVLVVCGTGNNGADGIAVARLLNEKGYDVDICIVTDKGLDKASESFRQELDIFKAYRYKIYDKDIINSIFEEHKKLGICRYDVIVDGIFGVGLSRDIDGIYYDTINKLNLLDALKISIDIPSGVCSSTGNIFNIAFSAEYTFTFSFFKLGHFLWPGVDFCGQVKCVDIGITHRSFLGKQPKFRMLEKSDLVSLPERKRNTNKSSYGKVLIIAGTKNMAGAAIFSALAAYKMGCGLVRIFTNEINRLIIQSVLPEAVLVTYDDETDINDTLKANLDWADSVVVGPGLGVGETSKEIVKSVINNTSCPTVFDADAINIISYNDDYKDLIKKATKDHNKIFIFTPHMGELSRLIKVDIANIKQNIIKLTQKVADDYKVICVSKDAHTIICESERNNFLNISGCEGLASAGSGDVLTGIIASLLGQKVQPNFATALGVYLHGLAGEYASRDTTASVMARDIADALKIIFKEIRY
ncbi:bifunctional ADP-dependent NAD(P)H-hydrate dehydratase/NAD(P)H-hydrate epimerase [Lachnobacterium bovis]|uniref:Bifunctional NAD(P)H-hydrate repair enzyme n=1 Tax=Lachnobacterium bovis TaxID=140626 RepID=A0A1H9PTP8_9FIRM|nr:bifunctional ADP-dependent NAD(P)H-hydrate dehydratase/NAD(P)H-hydrate epimerase [Lachnobacterium bovis]SER51149.1 NAD(P)H-hydrate epimerase [Lachnobacterium bovis]